MNISVGGTTKISPYQVLPGQVPLSRCTLLWEGFQHGLLDGRNILGGIIVNGSAAEQMSKTGGLNILFRKTMAKIHCLVKKDKSELTFISFLIDYE